MERPRRPVIPVQPVAGRPSAEALARIDWRWHWATLGWAPHRLGFFLALVVLGMASLWWAGVQAAPLAPLLVPPAVLPPAVVHAAVMKLGDGSGDAVVRVSDCGPGFDWRSWLRFRRQVASPSVSWSNVPTWGRGLVIMQAGARAMWWNEQGNEVSLRFSVREGGDCCASERSSGGRARGG